MNPWDLWDSTTITQFVREAVDAVLGNSERIAQRFAPLTPTTMETIARGNVKLRAIGKGRGIVADDATPPIFRPKLRFTEEAFNLMRLTEMTPIEESLRRKLQLNGTDPESVAQRDKAGADIITRVRAIAVRQENLSDYLVMKAVLEGQLTVQVANPAGQTAMDQVVIDYEYPTGNLTQAPTSFDSLSTAHPVDVMKAMQVQLRTTSGKYGTRFTMSTEVMNYILTADDTISRFNFQAAANFHPQVTEDLLKSLMWDPQNVEFNIVDDGWYDESAGYGSGLHGFLDQDKTRWIPKDTLVCEVPSPATDPLASMYDGMVPVQTNWDAMDYRGPGAQTYQQLLQGNLTVYYRWEARRFPMIHHPERIAVAKVVF
jgi:hypothetical protein